MTPRQPLFEKLEIRRRELGLSQSVLAERSGVSLPTVQRILSGHSPAASFENTLAIAQILGMQLDAVPVIPAKELLKQQALKKGRATRANGARNICTGSPRCFGPSYWADDQEDCAGVARGFSPQAVGRMTVAWNPIPGETPIDISGLKVTGVTNRQELSVVEAENVRKAIVKYLGGSLTRRTAKFDLSWMLKLHHEMFGDVWEWAGQSRTTNLNLGSPWHQVSIQLQDLCDDLAYWKKNWPDIIEQAAHLHHRAVQIHPFPNGNGRWSRLLANIWLKLHKQPLGTVLDLCWSGGFRHSGFIPWKTWTIGDPSQRS